MAAVRLQELWCRLLLAGVPLVGQAVGVFRRRGDLLFCCCLRMAGAGDQLAWDLKSLRCSSWLEGLESQPSVSASAFACPWSALVVVLLCGHLLVWDQQLEASEAILALAAVCHCGPARLLVA